MSTTKKRKANFYAGPSTLPVSVLEKLRDTIVDFEGAGLSIIETSHRSALYETIHNEAVALVRKLLGIPEEYYVLFLGGGATLQFSMVPLNLMPEGGKSDYVVSGIWAKKALADADLLGTGHVIFDGADSGYTTLPTALETSEDASYVHITSNETVNGIQWRTIPTTTRVPLVADMSSDIMSRPFDVGGLGLFYAGAQKNLGPAGVTLVVIHRDLVEPARPNLTAYLKYKTHTEKNSMYNTPPVFSIYALKLVLEWVGENGGVAGMERAGIEKSGLIYRAIDSSGGFYTNTIDPEVRSRMNIVFTLPSDELQKKFLAETESLGMLGLKGHRSVGGCRASLYNALPLQEARTLAEVMTDFARRNG